MRTKRKLKPYNVNPTPSDFPVRSDPTRVYDSTAANIAAHDKTFRDACAAASKAMGVTISPTRRQAAKWRRGLGSAYKHRQN